MEAPVVRSTDGLYGKQMVVPSGEVRVSGTTGLNARHGATGVQRIQRRKIHMLRLSNSVSPLLYILASSYIVQ